jgi:hypothetical protein
VNTAESTVTGPPKEAPRWYLDVRDRRAGPYDWTVILELARTGGLAADDRLWSPDMTAWTRVDEFSELAAVIAGECATTSPVSATGRRDSPRVRLALAAGLTWTVVAFAFVTLSMSNWPGFQDGLLIARLQTIGQLIVLALGIGALPAVWRATRSADDLESGLLRGALRIFAAGTAFFLALITLSAFINARDLFYVAIGDDPLGQAEIRLLPGGKELEVRGPLGAGIASRLARALADHPGIRFVHLNSPGGWVSEGEFMANLIRAHKLGTYTSTGCHSACVLAFVAGSPRLLNPEARIGLHSVSGEGMDPFLIGKVNETYQADLRRMGASESFITRATLAPPTQLWMPGPSELTANHVVDRVSAEGLAESGESLKLLAAEAANIEAGYAFIQLLAQTDPARFTKLDRSIRLALRRGVEESDLEYYPAELAAEIEVRRLPAVSDDTAATYAQGLRLAARQFSPQEPQQCVAILARNKQDLAGRSAAALRAIDPALKSLLAAPARGQPASIEADTQVLSKVTQLARTRARTPATEPTADDAAAACAHLLSMFDVALNENKETSAGLMRALRNDADVSDQGTVER